MAFIWKKIGKLAEIIHFTLHRGAFCQFPFWCSGTPSNPSTPAIYTAASVKSMSVFAKLYPLPPPLKLMYAMCASWNGWKGTWCNHSCSFINPTWKSQVASKRGPLKNIHHDLFKVYDLDFEKKTFKNKIIAGIIILETPAPLMSSAYGKPLPP